MDQKAVVALNSFVVTAGVVAMGIILCVRMSPEAATEAFACLVNASTRDTLAIAEASTC